MNRRPAVLLIGALWLSGCAAVRRGADDGIVVATAPIHLLTTPGERLSEAWRRDPASAAATAPIFVPLWIAGDLLFTAVSAVDLALTPIYAPWEVRRPQLYDLRRFPPRLRKSAMDDAAEGAAGALVLVAPLAAFALFLSGKGDWNPPATTPGVDPTR